MVDRRIDLGLSVGIVIFGLLLFVAAMNINLGTIQDPIGPRGVPTFLAIAFVVGGLILSFRRLTTWKAENGHRVPSEGTLDEPEYPASARRAFTIIAISVLYALLLPILGFVLATPVLLAVLMWTMQVRSRRLLVLVPIAYTLVVFLVFSEGLSVSLPLGPLTGPLEAIGFGG